MGHFNWLLKSKCLKAISLLYATYSAKFYACQVYSDSICITVAVVQPVVLCSPVSVLLHK